MATTNRSSAFVLYVAALSLTLLTLLVLTAPAAAQDPYPAPDQPAASGYPAPTSVPAPDAEQLDIETIGEGREGDPFAGLVEQAGAETVAQQPPSSSGNLFLWGSFLAALLIFATAVFGSITLFTRRNES